MLGPELLKELELTMKQVQTNFKTAQHRQKSHSNLKRTLKEFQVGEHVFVKVKPRKSSFKLGSCAKLASRYYGPFKILTKMEPMAYQLPFPPNLRIHNFFHVSILKKYVHAATHVIEWNVIQVEPEGDVSVELDCILDRR